MTDFEQLGPYRIDGKLGQGGMGAVYLGKHVSSGQKVAIKVIASEVADQSRFRRRFASEIETLKKLDHPNIVGLIGYGEEHGHLFFSMQIVEGPSLQQRLRQQKRLHWGKAIQYGIDICSALKHAHDLGVIHRDLKPANLLLSPDDKVLLTDFGIAKLWKGDDMTAVGAMLGTADYMAPEQAGVGPITQRTDLYALGNVLYALLVGRPPFAGKQLTKVITSIHTEQPPPIDMILPDLPDELGVLIHQLLAKAPEDRPPTALAVGNRLKAMQQGLQRREATLLDDESITVNKSDSTIFPEESFEIDNSNDGLATDERPTLDATLQSNGQTGLRSINETIDSVAENVGEFPLVEPQTHFRTVDQDERYRAAAPITAESEKENSLESILSASGLVGLLLLMVGAAFYWMPRTPTAESLLSRIRQAEDAGDIGSASGAISDFMKHYPDDPHASEVSDIADQLDSDRIYRRLRARARFKGGVEQLAPVEQALYEALLLREQQPEEARKHLESWLVVYGHADTLKDFKIAQLSKVVRKEIQSMNLVHNTKSNKQSAALNAWIESTLESTTPDKHTAFLQGVIDLFGSKPWAKNEVAHATDLLEKLSAVEQTTDSLSE